MKLGGGVGAHSHLQQEITGFIELFRGIQYRKTVVAPAVAGRADFLTIPAGTLTAEGVGFMVYAWGVNLAGNDKTADFGVAVPGGGAAQFVWCRLSLLNAETYAVFGLVVRGTTNIRGKFAGTSWPGETLVGTGRIRHEHLAAEADVLLGGVTWDANNLALTVQDTSGAGQLNVRGAYAWRVGVPSIV